MVDEKVVHFKLYVHRSKEANYDDFVDLGGDSDSAAASDFRYTGYEICLHTMVNLETGECEAYGIEDTNGELVEFARAIKV